MPKNLKEMEQSLLIAKDLIKNLLERTEEYNDCGPIHEGWRSDELEDLRMRAEEFIKNGWVDTFTMTDKFETPFDKIKEYAQESGERRAEFLEITNPVEVKIIRQETDGKTGLTTYTCEIWEK